MRGTVLVVLAACGHAPATRPPSSPCEGAIAGFASAEPAHLVVMPATCTRAELAAMMHDDNLWTRGSLGDANATYEMGYLSSPRLKNANAFLDEHGHVRLITAEMPPGTEAQYRAALGEPDVAIDYVFGDPDVVLRKGELLWLSRGVTLVVSKGLIRVGIFPPTTLEQYAAKLKFIDIEDVDEG
ncbi:MAG TPA: hypothetical protein VMZ53_11635 [Kofleriaceae bacterium]|nr:hypothetical protein [Kofleriaceae bacterium]